MKLSKTQQEVLDGAKARIDFARNHDFYEWVRANISLMFDFTNEQIDAELAKRKEQGWKVWEHEAYEETKNGFTWMYCNSRTLHKLAEYGLIEILRDSTGESYASDSVKVLNY